MKVSCNRMVHSSGTRTIMILSDATESGYIKPLLYVLTRGCSFSVLP